MLTRTQLADLYKKLRDTNVLSVYIDADQNNPADRRAWYTALEHGLAEERRRIAALDASGVDAFDAASRRIMDELAQHKAFLPERGWVGFATEDALHYAEGVAVPMPDLVRWEFGIRAAPYVRALKQGRVVVTALADRRKARIFTYRTGTLTEHTDLLADLDHGDLHESTSSHRAATQTGSRGETGTDAGQRALDVSASRLHAHVIEEVEKLAGRDGFVVFGGTGDVVAGLARQVGGLTGRVAERPSMHVDMAEPEVLAETEAAASELTLGAQGTVLGEVLDAARAQGRGCFGVKDTTEALRDGRVDLLVVSRGLREREMDLVDHLIGAAFDHGAAIEEISAEVGARLDAEGEGVAARLRYTV